MRERNDLVRPVVMESITAVQLDELRLQYDDNDRDQFNALADSYGWTLDDADQVWNFFMAGELQTHPHDIP
jgi:hypothetical protein